MTSTSTPLERLSDEGPPRTGPSTIKPPSGRRRIRPWGLAGGIGTHAVLIAICLAWVYPFIWMVSTAFKGQYEIFTNALGLVPDSPSVDNFVRAWNSAHFGQFTVNTAVVAIGSALLVVAVSSLAGYALGRGDMPGKRIVIGVLVATMFLPKGYTILPIYILINFLGLNNTLFGIILAESGPAHIVAILLFMGYFAQIPRELEESAMVDGAGTLRIYFRIMLPLAKPIAATVFLFNFLSAWNAFLVPLVLTLGAPERRTLGVGMYSFFGENVTDWTGLAAGAVISVLPIIVVFLFLQKYFIEGFAGAVKS